MSSSPSLDLTQHTPAGLSAANSCRNTRGSSLAGTWNNDALANTPSKHASGKLKTRSKMRSSLLSAAKITLRYENAHSSPLAIPHAMKWSISSRPPSNALSPRQLRRHRQGWLSRIADRGAIPPFFRRQPNHRTLQEPQVRAAYAGQGLTLVNRRRLNGWSTLVYARQNHSGTTL